MTEAAKPANENERLSVLRDLRILDTPLEERFERITRIVCRSLRVPISAITLVDEDRQWFKSSQGLPATQIPRAHSFCAHAILQSDAFIVPNALDDKRFADNPFVVGSPNIRFYAGIPLEVQDGIRIGSLCAVDNEPREMDQEQIEILKDLSEMVKSELAAVQLTSAHMELIAELESAERAAAIDPLTKLWNRGGAEKLLDKEYHAAQRNGTSLTLALLDIDHFKQVNDQHGHDMGDAALRAFATTVSSAMRRSDSFCRWGGEEFLLVMPDCDADHASQAINRVLNAIRANREPLPITASVGAFTLVPGGASTVAQALKYADTALYEAKQGGRDQLRIANPAPIVGGTVLAA